MAMPRRARSLGGSAPIASFCRKICPELARKWPAIRVKSVDLPAPFGPMMPRSSPASTSRLTPRTAWIPPKLRLSSATRSIRGSLGRNGAHELLLRPGRGNELTTGHDVHGDEVAGQAGVVGGRILILPIRRE